MNKKLDESSFNNLLKLTKEISDLIEDNNQNIRDCIKVLNRIDSAINPKRRLSFVSLIKKLLNIFK